METVYRYAITSYTQEQLIDELQYDGGVMTRTMKLLGEKGYVIRSYVFSPSDKAMALKPKIVKILYDWYKSLLDGIDPVVLDKVEEALSIMAQNASNRFKGLKGDK